MNICDYELYTEDVEEAWLSLKTMWSYTTLATNVNICLFTDIAIIGIEEQGAADFTIMQSGEIQLPAKIKDPVSTCYSLNSARALQGRFQLLIAAELPQHVLWKRNLSICLDRPLNL